MNFTRRRRRQHQFDPLSGLIVAVLSLLLLLGLIESPLGLLLVVALTLAAILYGRVSAHQQAEHARRWRTVTNLRSLSGVDFEQHVAELYRKLGYRAKITRGSGDQGVDVIAENSQQRVGIQCKQWQAKVGNDAVQQALAGKIYYDCTDAAVICTSTFTPLARELATRSGVELIDGAAYASMVNEFVAEPLATLASKWIPHGKPLRVQIAMLTAAVLICVIHFTVPLKFGAAATTFSRITASTPQNSSTLAATVQRFYDDINGKRYADAYALLSSSFQAQQSYDDFARGYANTLSVTANITASTNTTVNVQLQAEDASASGPIVTNYTGSWTGIMDSRGEWKLDSSGMRRV